MSEDTGQAKRVPRIAFREYGVTGLDFTMGLVQADPKVAMHGIKGIEQYDMMRHEDPTVAATLLALSLPVREASWRVNPASDKPVDVAAAEFVDTCLHDMSSTLDDVLTEICTMFPFGWAWLEWVLKKRSGRNPRTGPASKYNDGRLGFRKIALRAQTSLYEWEIEDDGGIRGMVQYDQHHAENLTIPIEKSLLFRTTRERNNPEGFSVLRPSWRSWKFKYNIERIEAIGLQRALMGVPHVHFTTGGSDEGPDSDKAKADALIRELHENTALGITTPENMEFEFVTPDMQGITGDSTRVIQRYDEAIARATLAMYILLGSRERGSYALSRELGDLFFLAVDGFINIIAQTFNQWAIPVLMRYNVFPGITEYPQIDTAINRRVDLAVLADFINKVVGQQVITPDAELERHVRELADFPPRVVSVEGEEPVTPTTEQVPGKTGGGAPEGGGEQAEGKETPEEARAWPAEIEQFAQSDRLAGYHDLTDEYQTRLREIYLEWVDDVSTRFAELSPEVGMEGAREAWDAEVALLVVALKELAWEYLPRGMQMGYRSAGLDAEMRGVVDAEIAENDAWMADKLGAAIRDELDVSELQELMILHWGGRHEDASRFLTEQLQGRAGHVGLYAGHVWRMIELGALYYLVRMGNDGTLRWVLDPIAQHCNTCLLFGDREYDNMADLLRATGGLLPGQGTECNGHCRCFLVRVRGGGLVEVL